MKTRVTFYIDGFNFYYGIRRSKGSDPKWKRAYWIDMVKLCSQFLGENQELEKVIYFTATPLSAEKSSRQSAFLNANKLINGVKFEIVRGRYLEKHISCPYCHGDISRPEEKKTDVNITVRMIADCVQGKTDSVALVSADTDLMPPIEFIHQNYPNIGVKIYFPPSNYNSEVRDTLSHWRKKPILMIKSFYFFDRAHMPNSIEINGKRIVKPQEWI
ncbi:MAG: NYN domain-containing protein [Bacteroidales bacterium]|nr:NYN domain-containing protein [Bacteroidales bacterium]